MNAITSSRQAAVRKRASWNDNADRFAAFVALTGRLPSVGGGVTEGALRQWLYQQRADAAHGRSRFTDERRSRLDEICPDWQSARAFGHSLNNELWQESAAATVAFSAEHGRWPNMDAADPQEQALGRWLTKQRRDTKAGKARSTPERQDYLDTYAPGWEKTRDELWFDSAESLAAFYAAQGRWPNPTSPDAHEAVYGRWLGRQRYAVTTERAAHLDQLLPGWRGVARAPER